MLAMLEQTQPVVQEQLTPPCPTGTRTSASDGVTSRGLTAACKTLSGQADAGSAHAAIEGLRVQALAGLDSTREALRERIQTVMMGKTILDDGGESAVRALQAKRASIDIAKKDSDFVAHSVHTLALLEDAAARLLQTQSEQDMELGDTFTKRIITYKAALDMLKESPSPLDMSPAEHDALALVHARNQLSEGVGSSYQLLRSKTTESLDAIQTKLTLIDHSGLVTPLQRLQVTSTFNGSFAKLQELPDTATVHLQEGCKLLQNRARTQLQVSLEAVTTRVDTARAGRQLLNLGGDAAVHALSAKKASIDVAVCDVDAVQNAQSMSAEYSASASKLMLAAAHPRGDFALLAEKHMERAQIYERVVIALANPVHAPTLSAPERDAYAILQASATGTCAAVRVADGVGGGLTIATSRAAGCADFVKAWISTKDNSIETPRIERCPCA